MAMGDTHYLDTWRTLEKILKTGKVKAIGLSNFTKEQIQDILDEDDFAVQQVRASERAAS